MNPAVIGSLIPIISTIAIVCMIIFMRHYTNIERMAMIDKGLNPYLPKPNKVNPSTTLRFALLAIGAGLGILFGNMLSRHFDMTEEVAFFSMILIFGGLGLLGSYLYELKLVRKTEAERQRENARVEM
jgi:hypothetical protein